MLILLTKILAFAAAISVHEAAHAWAADRLGDPTARISGRLSLNPLRHIDLFGTVLLPLFLIMSGAGFVIGWAKPVMFDPFNLRKPRRDAGLIGLAGPVSNLLMAAIAALVMRLIGQIGLASLILTPFIIISVLLAVFNLVPLHPLDGGKIVTGFLPKGLAQEWEQVQNRWGTLLLIFLIIPWGGGGAAVFYLIGPMAETLIKLLLPV